jgi:hypothetical protein
MLLSESQMEVDLVDAEAIEEHAAHRASGTARMAQVSQFSAGNGPTASEGADASQELVASSASAHAVFEQALERLGIQGTAGTIQRLIDERQWIFPSERVRALRKKQNMDQLYDLFNCRHHIHSSTRLFEFLATTAKKVCVVYGHRAQGND